MFLEEVAGVTSEAKVTTTSVYLIIEKELLAISLPGRPSKQAPRMLVCMLRALEQLTVDEQALPYLRIYSWWVLLQSWGTMRFSDHRGLNPADITVQGNSLVPRLTRSKTTGDDKDVAFRLVHVSDCCFFVSPSWLCTGWSLLKSLADFPRDFLLPAPCQGCLTQELRFDIGFSMQQRVLASLRIGTAAPFSKSVVPFWTPHSARSFLPSATAALGVQREQRDYLGGWSAKGSDRYSRVALKMIANVQKMVITAQLSTAADPFSEAETLGQLDDYLCSKGASPVEREKFFKTLVHQPPQRRELPEQLSLEECDQSRAGDVEAEPDRVEEVSVDPHAKRDKRLKSENAKSEALGSNPKEAREKARATLQSGYYISISGRSSMKVPHRLGSCYMVPGIDYPRFIYFGKNDAWAIGVRPHMQTMFREGYRGRQERLGRHSDVVVDD